MKRKLGIAILLLGLIACKKQDLIRLDGTVWESNCTPRTTIKFGAGSVVFTTLFHDSLEFKKLGVYEQLGDMVSIRFNKIPVRDLCGELDGEVLRIDSYVYTKR